MKNINSKAIYLLLAGLVLVFFVAFLVLKLPATAPTPISCTEEARVCPDGTAVGRVGPDCEFAKCPDAAATCSSPSDCTTKPIATTSILQIVKDDILRVDNLQAGQVIVSPLALSGQARGPWFFEASFPVILLDANGKVLVETFATAQAEWMTTNYVPFTANLKFTKPITKTGTLVFSKDNPSGLPENSDTLDVPIRFE